MTLAVPCTAKSLKNSPLNKNNAHVFVKFFDEDKHSKMLYLSDFMDLNSKDILTLTNTKQVQMTAEKKVHSASTNAVCNTVEVRPCERNIQGGCFDWCQSIDGVFQNAR